MIEQIMNMPEYKEAKKKDETQMVLHTLLRFTFIGMAYLESNFHCKKKGMLNFVEYVKGTMQRIDIHDDVAFFDDSNKYYKENYDIDLMQIMGLAIEWSDKK